MSSAFWISIGVTALVIAAHVALFVFFLRDPKKKKKKDAAEKDDEPSG